MKVNILGTEYSIETHKVSDDSYLEKNKLAGYCGEESKLIVIADMTEEKYFFLTWTKKRARGISKENLKTRNHARILE